MKTKHMLFQIKNQILGTIFPQGAARKAARLFLTPKRFPVKEWEKEAEAGCERIPFGNGLSAARWGNGGEKILIMHGWESRATQLYSLVPDLIGHGFEVIGIDAPGHGHSQGRRANPVMFAEAIQAADQTFGPFYGAIGHSMGGAALSIAMEAGVRFQRVVLISSPNNLFDVLTAFAGFIGLPGKAARLFVDAVEHEVGRSANALDVGKVFAALNPEALIIHAKNDREVPFACHEAIIRSCPGLKAYRSESLGHRRIVRSPEVSAMIGRFMRRGQTQRQPVSAPIGMERTPAWAI